MAKTVSIVSLLALFSATASAAAAPELRQPTGKWVVDFADDMCVLQRDYGTPDKPLTLALYPDPTKAWVTLYVLDSPTGEMGGNVPGKIGFGNASAAAERELLTFDMSRKNLRRTSVSLEREELERSVASGVLSVSADDRLNVALQVPQLGSALKVLDECVVDLLADWGFSREEQQAMANRPELADPDKRHVQPSDYPSLAVSRSEMGINSARFTVGSDGRTSNCSIVESSGSESLDQALCRAISRARYTPARDRSGKPMDSIDFVRVQWWLN